MIVIGATTEPAVKNDAPVVEADSKVVTETAAEPATKADALIVEADSKVFTETAVEPAIKDDDLDNAAECATKADALIGVLVATVAGAGAAYGFLPDPLADIFEHVRPAVIERLLVVQDARQIQRD
jgi:hypothetical protein